jgi:phenylpyruvate tautomerase PptA (4-oxalocrotonate tautomerase family)
MKTTPTTKPLPIEEQVPAFEKDLANADAMRASTLSRLQGLLASKARHTEREQELIAAERGKDDADAVMLKAEVADNQRFVRELTAESDRATTGSLVADKQSWILHGFVRNRVLEGQPNLTVALFSGAGRWIEGLGHACTDERGYFQLRYTPASGPAPGKEGERPDAATQRELFIRVSNSKQEVLDRDKKPTTVALGEVKYREIILGDEGDCCSPPPSDTSAKTATSSTKPSAKPSKTQKARVSKKTPKDKKP